MQQRGAVEDLRCFAVDLLIGAQDAGGWVQSAADVVALLGEPEDVDEVEGGD